MSSLLLLVLLSLTLKDREHELRDVVGFLAVGHGHPSCLSVEADVPHRSPGLLVEEFQACPVCRDGEVKGRRVVDL